MQNKPKSLQELIRDNPEAKAYWREVSKRTAEGYTALDAARLTCESCDGTGYVRHDVSLAHPDFGKLFPCPDPNCPVLKQQREDRYAKLCTLAQIPAGYQALSFADWQNLYAYPDFMEGKQDALGAALAFVAARDRAFLFSMDEAAALVGLPAPVYVTGDRCSIAFYGKPGVGKTSLAVSIARSLLDAREAVVYLQLKSFFDALKKTFNGSAEEDENEVLQRYQQAPVLVIDEFPIEATEWQKGRAYDLVNYRYANRLPTIITTNYTVEQLIAAWGMQIGHRLQAACHWIEVGGLELRQRNPMVKSR